MDLFGQIPLGVEVTAKSKRLMEALGVSDRHVRTVLHRLQADGLIEFRTWGWGKRGYVIRRTGGAS